MKQLKLFKGDLGKLPTSLYSEREYFLLWMWDIFLQKGVHDGHKENGNSNPFKDNAELAKFIMANYPDLKAVEVKVLQNNEQRIWVSFNDKNATSVSFNPNKLATIIYKIAGVERLMPRSGEINIHNSQLQKVSAPFLIKNDYISEEIGIKFSDKGIAAYSSVCVLWIKTQVKSFGSFDRKGNHLYPTRDLGLEQHFEIDAKSRIKLEIEPLIRELTILRHLYKDDEDRKHSVKAFILTASRFGIKLNDYYHPSKKDTIQVEGDLVNGENVKVGFAYEIMLPILRMLKSQKVTFLELQVNEESTRALADVEIKGIGNTSMIIMPIKPPKIPEKVEVPQVYVLNLKYKYRLLLQKQQLINI